MHLIHQVFDGIQYLHTNGMIHRDLKPENLLMVGRDPGTEEYMMLKIADFGLSAQRSAAKSDQDWEKTLQEFCGTQDYLAPEVFTLAAKRNKGHVHYTGKVDVWAAGVIYSCGDSLCTIFAENTNLLFKILIWIQKYGFGNRI